MDARAIYQANLDAVSGAMWAGRFEEATRHLMIPGRMSTQDATRHVTRAEDLIEAMRGFCENLRKSGATDFHRICMAADFVDSAMTRIEGRHVAHALRGGSYVMDPVESEMTLQWVDGFWLGAGIVTRASNRKLQVLGPGSTPIEKGTDSDA